MRDRNTMSVVQQFGVLSRAPQRILAAQTEIELRDTLGACLRGLYRKLLQYELYVREDGGNLVPAVRLGEGQVGNSVRLLASLKARLALREGDTALGQAVALPALLGVKRGPLMSAPLLDASEMIGLIVVEGVGRDFTALDLDVLEGVAALFSLALQRLRAKETEYAQVRIERDLKSARAAQRRLMSERLPPGIGVTAYAEYLPAFDVGGDFYDLQPVGMPERSVVRAVIGDVSGKGVTAALFMSGVMSELRRWLGRDLSPAQVLARVNEALEREDSEMFATASCLTIDPSARRLAIASAGHVPVLVRRAHGQVFTFGGASGTPLGMMPCDYQDDLLDLDPGDIVLLMTDGLVEALDRPSDRMGMHLLFSLIKYAPHDPRVIVERSLEAVHKMKGQKPLDDVTLVALRLDP